LRETDQGRILKILCKKNHFQLAESARKEYYHTRSKAIENHQKKDISMIVVAGGGAGCIHFPNFPTTVKVEPVRHEMLRIKCTFVKVP